MYAKSVSSLDAYVLLLCAHRAMAQSSILLVSVGSLQTPLILTETTNNELQISTCFKL